MPMMTFSCKETPPSVVDKGRGSFLHVVNIVLRCSGVVGAIVENLEKNTLSLNPAILVLKLPTHDGCQVWSSFVYKL